MTLNRSGRRSLLPCLLLLSSLTSLGQAAWGVQDPGHVYDPAHDHDAKLQWKGDPYLLPTDPVSGASLGPIEKQVVLQHEGRELRFATQESADTFKANPQKFLGAVDALLVRQQSPFYPTDACVVSDRKLGELGPPVDFIYRNRLVRLSSKDGEQTFLQDPAKYIKKLDRAVVEKQLAAYPLKTCVVSGEELGGASGDPIDLVFGMRLVRFCCRDCQKDFRKDPLKYLEKLGHERQGNKHGSG